MLLPEKYQHLESFAFGDGPNMSDELLALVIAGSKIATCCALRDLEADGEALPKVGAMDIVLDGRGQPGAVIRTLEVQIRRFDKVDEQFAHDEGEGLRTLADWKRGHRAFFERNGGWSKEMELVCERFELVEVLNHDPL